MTKGNKIVVQFAMEKPTPGTIRYQEVDADGNPVKGPDIKIGTLYIKKATLGNDIPARLQVEITARCSMPRVALILKVTPAQPMALAGALVRHGLSSRQAMEVIRILAKKDVVLTLTGTIQELNTTFNPHGLMVEARPLPQTEEVGEPNIQPLDAAE